MAKIVKVKGREILDSRENPTVEVLLGMPLVYELDDDLKPIRNYYLGDSEKVRKAMEAVAAQAKAETSLLMLQG